MSSVMQQKQLKKLNRITGADFHFVPANKNQFGVKHYEHTCANDEEFQRIAGELNQRQNVFYTCLEYPGGNISIAVVQNELDKHRIEKSHRKYYVGTRTRSGGHQTNWQDSW